MSSWASWMSAPQYLAQAGHFLGGALVIFVAGVYSHDAWTLYAFGIGAVIAALKEFVIDVASWGESDSWADSAMDYAFYVLGGSAGMLLTHFAFAGGYCS